MPWVPFFRKLAADDGSNARGGSVPAVGWSRARDAGAGGDCDRLGRRRVVPTVPIGSLGLIATHGELGTVMGTCAGVCRWSR